MKVVITIAQTYMLCTVNPQYANIKLNFQNNYLEIEDYFKQFTNLFVIHEEKHYDMNNDIHLDINATSHPNEVENLISGQTLHSIDNEKNHHDLDTQVLPNTNNQFDLSTFEDKSQNNTLNNHQESNQHEIPTIPQIAPIQTQQVIPTIKQSNGLHYSLMAAGVIALSGLSYQIAKNMNMNNSWDIYRWVNKSPYAWCQGLNKTTETRVADICIVPTQAQILDKDYANSYSIFFNKQRKDVSLENQKIVANAEEQLKAFEFVKNPQNRLPFKIADVQTAANELYQIIDTNNGLTIKQANGIVAQLEALRKQDELLIAQQINKNIVLQLEDGSLVNELGQVLANDGSKILGELPKETFEQLIAQQAQTNQATQMQGNIKAPNSTPIAKNTNNKTKTLNKLPQVSNANQTPLTPQIKTQQGGNKVTPTTPSTSAFNSNKGNFNPPKTQPHNMNIAEAARAQTQITQGQIQKLPTAQQQTQPEYDYVEYYVPAPIQQTTPQSVQSATIGNNNKSSTGGLRHHSFKRPNENKEDKVEQNESANSPNESDDEKNIKSSRYYDIKRDKRKQENSEPITE